MYDGETNIYCLTFAVKLLCDIFQVSGTVNIFFVFYENNFINKHKNQDIF